MGIPGPKFPVRADHRFIQNLLKTTLGGKVESVPTEFEMLSRVFRRAGGSWQRVFQGSPQDTDFLKRIIRRAFQSGRLTKKRRWEGKSDEPASPKPIK